MSPVVELSTKPRLMPYWQLGYAMPTYPFTKVPLVIKKGASKPIMNKSEFPKTYNQSNKFYFVEKIKKQVLGEKISEEDMKLIQ